MQSMHRNDLQASTGSHQASLSITLSLSITDAQALWAAAAERALAAPGTTLGDVLDTIGPREDPSIADCLAMLLVPSRLAGCTLDDFDARPAGGSVVAWPTGHALAG